MAVETEIKLRVESHEPMRRRLTAAGAHCTGHHLEQNIILDRPDGSLHAAGCGLRIREETFPDGGPPCASITFKGPLRSGPMKSREEIELVVDGIDGAVDFFNRLGFIPVLIYEKLRESWLLDDCRVELDRPPKIGLFVEIEGPTESSIQRVRGRIGLSDTPSVRESYVQLLIEYCDDNRITPRVLRMEASAKR